MTKKIIQIGADVEDTYFKFPQEVMSDIVDSLYKNNKIEIHFTEGIALEELNIMEKKFLDILKDVCEKNAWPLDRIHFVTPNLTQNKAVWPSISFGNAFITNPKLEENFFLRPQIEQISIKKEFNKTFGMFVHRSSWDRLWLGSYLYNNHKNITMQTFHRHLDNPAHMLTLGMDQLMYKLSIERKMDRHALKQISEFVANLPIDFGSKWSYDDKVSTTVDPKLLSRYNDIFVDLVCEKMITGQTFFPTEKTARSLATKTPFIIMSAPRHIENLKRLGFRSFRRWWDESYDFEQGARRIESIEKIISDLSVLDKDQLQSMYTEMLPTLEHNYRIYVGMTPAFIKSTFNIN